MSRIRLNRPEYGLAHLTAETEENKNISIPLIYKQDITPFMRRTVWDG